MRIVFFGTGNFGIPVMGALLESSHDVVCAVTQPDRQKGRGHKVQPTPIKEYLEATSPNIEVFQPEIASEPDACEYLKTMNADMFVVVDYGQILKQDVLDIPHKFCINLHPSLLPKYRGAAPVNWAIMNGETRTGVTVFKMDKRMDAGEMILQDDMYIDEEDDSVKMLELLSYAGARLVVDALDRISSGRYECIPQKEKEATYAPKLKKADGVINWADTALKIRDKIRGLQPWPMAYTTLDGKTLKIFSAEGMDIVDDSVPVGGVLDPSEFIIRTSDAAIKLKKVQIEGKKPMMAEEFLRGHEIDKETVLGE